MDDRLFNVIMNRLDKIENTIAEQSSASSLSRQRIYEKAEQTDRKLERVGIEVENVKEVLTTIQPTVQEFVAYKAQVVGAGRLGRGLWWIGGLILTAAASIVSYLAGRH